GPDRSLRRRHRPRDVARRGGALRGVQAGHARDRHGTPRRPEARRREGHVSGGQAGLPLPGFRRAIPRGRRRARQRDARRGSAPRSGHPRREALRSHHPARRQPDADPNPDRGAAARRDPPRARGALSRARHAGAPRARRAPAPGAMTMIGRMLLMLGLAAPAAALDLAGARLVDLTHPFDSRTIYWPTARHFTLEPVAHGVTAGGWWYAANDFCAAE